MSLRSVCDDDVTRRIKERITAVSDDTLLVRIQDVDTEMEVYFPARDTKQSKERSTEQ